MENRTEDMPKVIALSLAIIAVFSVFIWQRVHGAEQPPSAATQQAAPAPNAQSQPSVATDTVAAGQIRLLTDKALDGPGNGASHTSLRSDAFRPLDAPVAAAHGPSLKGSPFIAPLPGLLMPQPGPLRTAPPGLPAPRQPTYTVTLEGALGAAQDMEAVCTVHDPKIADPGLSDHTVFLHVGDIFGGRRIDEIDAAGMRLRGADRWEIGQGRHVADATVVAGFARRAAPSGRKQAVAVHSASAADETADTIDTTPSAMEAPQQPLDRLANH